MVRRCSSSPIPSVAREPYSLTRFPIHCGSSSLYGRGNGHLTCVAQALLPVHDDDRGGCRHRQEYLCHIFLTFLFTPILKQMWPQPGAINLSRRLGDHRHRTNRFYNSGPSASGVGTSANLISAALRHNLIADLEARKLARQLVKPDIDHRRGVQREQLAEQQSADDSDAQRMPQL